MTNSTAQLLDVAVLGVGFVVLLLLKIAEALSVRRAIRELPPNTSDGKPAVTSQRERWLAFLFCVFVLAVISWLIVS